MSSAGFDVKREELITTQIEAHFRRLDEFVEQHRGRIVELEARVAVLEDENESMRNERRRMMAWMAWNRVDWPPPDDSPI